MESAYTKQIFKKFYMPLKPALFTGMLVVVLTTSVTTKGETAAELINQAHKHDSMYTLGPEADQQQALSLYQSALAAKPDDKQRLHILYRMAQLNGSAYRLEKGEKPDFHKALSLYKEIIDSYPPDEPLVYKAMSSICDHYTTLREFETALTWSKKVLEYDTGQIDTRLGAIKKQIEVFEQESSRDRANSLTPEERVEIKKLKEQARSLRKDLNKIRRYQTLAVDQIAYSAALIDPLRAHGELRNIAERYAGSFIADRANQRLQENMARMPNLWAPQYDFPEPLNSTLQADFGSPVALSENQKDIQTQLHISHEAAEEHYYVEPNTTEKPQEDKHIGKKTRAPPTSYLSIYIAIAAGLIILASTAIIIIKKVTIFLRS